MGFSAPDGGLLAAAAHGFRRPNPQPQLAGSALAGQLLPFTTTYCSVTAGSARLGFRLPFRLHARSDLLQRYYSTYSVRLFALLSPRPCGTVVCGPMPTPTPTPTGTKRDTTTLAAGASDTAAEPSLSVPSLKRKRRVRNLFSCFSPVAMAWPSC